MSGPIQVGLAAVSLAGLRPRLSEAARSSWQPAASGIQPVSLKSIKLWAACEARWQQLASIYRYYLSMKTFSSKFYTFGQRPCSGAQTHKRVGSLQNFNRSTSPSHAVENSPTGAVDRVSDVCTDFPDKVSKEIRRLFVNASPWPAQAGVATAMDWRHLCDRLRIG